MQRLSLIDTHAHLDMKDFTADCDAVVARAVDAGVDKILTAGTDVKSSARAVDLSQKYPQVFAAVGIHPHEAGNVQKADINRIAEISKSPKVVALGEMGLDFYRNYSPREAQLQVLKWQLELATEVSLPVIIHDRQATSDIQKILAEWVKLIYPRCPGVIHCFSGNKQSAAKYMEMGFYLAFGGYISYPGSNASEVIKTIPYERLLVETDCPFLPPQKYRGKRNEPAYAVLTAEVLAGILGKTVQAVAEQTTENAERLFGFDRG
ncbi:MAG: TatD family hydrolase [Dehalococcoidales bacterium]|nr:TatD family hydrolase [Dehalococcoidales bacterium]